MSKITTFFATAGVALAMATAASAGTAYNNGGPDGQNGNEATSWIQAEDFSVGADIAINGADVYLASAYGFGSFNGNVEYWVFGDSEGAPGAALAHGNSVGALTDTGQPFGGLSNVNKFSFGFEDAFNAVAGEQYWFGFHIGNSDQYDRQNIYWVTTSAGGGGCGGECATALYNGHESYEGKQNNWANNEQEHAFQLNSAVPEPATWALMIMGFGSAGAMLRRRRAVAA